MTGSVRSESSRTGQALGWPGLGGLPFQGLNSAVALVLYNGAGGSEPLAHNEWGGYSSLPRKVFPASRGWGGITTTGTGVARRLLPASSEAHGPVSGQTWGTHQSELGAERESLRRFHSGIVRAKIHESQAS